MTTRGRIIDRIPAPISLRFRSSRRMRRLASLHEPADLVSSLVPAGRTAVDVGANRGIYACWIATRASRVDAFEPQPLLAHYIASARIRNLRVHQVALSDAPGIARLVVPEDDGMASIRSADRRDPTAPDPVSRIIDVRTETLDWFKLVDVGFLKIDVEGHEMAVLRGAEVTITASRPVVFIESEARHAPGAPASVIEWMRERHGYTRVAFVRRWHLVDIEQFDLQRDQLSLLPDYMDPDYVSNFVLWP